MYIYIIFSINNRLFLPVCFPSSLESTPGFSPSITQQSLQFWLIYEWFHRLTSLIIHHSFIPGLKPSFSANPSHRSHLLSFFFFRTDSTDSPDFIPILLSVSVFYFFQFLVAGFVRWIKLTNVRFWAHVKIASCIVLNMQTPEHATGKATDGCIHVTHVMWPKIQTQPKMYTSFNN